MSPTAFARETGILGVALCVALRGNRLEGRRSGFRARSAHADLAADHRALFDHDRRRLDVTFDIRALVKHDLRLGDDVAVDGAAHDDGLRANLGVDLAALSDDESVLAGDLAVKATVDSNGVAKRELAFELGSLIDECGEATRSG
jgi:hypothetical protein